jgi:Domain of unknown function (DUF4129)
MERVRLAWVCLTCLLLILTFGTISTGRLSGLGSLNLGGSSGGIVGGGSSTTEVVGVSGVSVTSTSGSTTTIVSSTASEYIAPVAARVTTSELLLYAAVGIALAGGLAFLLRSSGETGVYDFAAAMDQLDKQRSLVQGSWSRKLRNVALLRYYSLMRTSCTKMGLEDVPSETPLEYLSRVAAALKISQKDAADFAAAFDRARYGGELSDEDTENAAAYMARFVNGLRENLPHG